MRVHYIQHVPFEGLGYIETWLKENNRTITSTAVWNKPIFPSMNDFDFLIIIGGPMGVYDDHRYSWLSDEKNFIFDAIKAEKKIIGICLGAQLLACVLGATIYTNKYKEIGWFPIKIASSFTTWLGADLLEELTVFHWHGDTFDIPYGGENHASSAACNHQLFIYGDNILGLQFHLEATPESILAMLENENGELKESPFIQTKEEILHAAAYFSEANILMKRILKKFCG